ncbi:uncharacterized protein STEHIDRAFT_114557 [Stereum hirsutum FP-91666 SS1]|uniref:uncharacterized protein n=1 Tax=Stereum hirsutum (strain FP-91666) TaxID=721885 RepID=UPI0004449639|nr:uncharacterized protein STEHIDRAFT_114557 [Stereum hirsutum FP-91666 SS1]EIM81866.1 hypothetical protein STEHIDRAFT_114557 [Stereum hirsutum FP-91666 SS1]
MSTSAVQPASESKTTSRKRRKVSDLALAELSIIYDHLQKLRINSLDDDLSDISDDLDEVLAKIEKKLNVPKHTPFSSINQRLLAELQITEASELALKSDSSRRTEEAKSVGADKFMSSTTMLSFLQLLEDHTIRSICMRPSHFNTHVVALLVGQDETDIYRFSRDITFLRTRTTTPGFFIAEAKASTPHLVDYVPQAVAEMMTCAKRTHLRGVLTNGELWVFVIVIRNPECPGGGYYTSPPIQLQRNKAAIDEDSANTISGILAAWIERSFDDIGEDDWFFVSKRF